MGFNYFGKIVLFALVFSIFLPATVQAEIKSGTTEIGLAAGALFADQGIDDNDNSFQLNLSLGANISENVGVELSLLNSLDSLSDTPSTTFFTLNTVLKLFPDADINPFFLMGVGAGTFEDNTNNSARFAASGGVGLYFSFWKNAVLRLDVRDYMTFNDITHNFTASLGVMYVFDFMEPLQPVPGPAEGAVPYRQEIKPVSRPIEPLEIAETVPQPETAPEAVSKPSVTGVAPSGAEEIKPAEEEFEPFEETAEPVEEPVGPIEEAPAQPVTGPAGPARQALPKKPAEGIAPAPTVAAPAEEEFEPFEETAEPVEEPVGPIEEAPARPVTGPVEPAPQAVPKKPAEGIAPAPTVAAPAEEEFEPFEETAEPVEEPVGPIEEAPARPVTGPAEPARQAAPQAVPKKPAAGIASAPTVAAPAEEEFEPFEETAEPVEEPVGPIEEAPAQPVTGPAGPARQAVPKKPAAAVTPVPTVAAPAEEEFTARAVPEPGAAVRKKPSEVIKTAEKAQLYKLHILHKGAMLGIDFPFQDSEITSRSFDLLLELIAYMKPTEVKSISIVPLSSEYESIQEISDIGQERASRIIDMFERNSTVDNDLFTIVAPDRVRLRKFYDESEGRTNRVYIIVSFE